MSQVGRRSPAEAVQTAVAAMAAGRMVIVVDDADREDEGDLIVAAELMTTETMAFLVRNTTGIVCAPMPAARAAALQLPLMVSDNTDSHGTAAPSRSTQPRQAQACRRQTGP